MARQVHLCKALPEKAENCCQANQIEAIFDMLRARFSLSPKQGQYELRILKKVAQTTLQKYSIHVKQLVSVAYGDLPDSQWANMAKTGYAVCCTVLTRNGSY